MADKIKAAAKLTTEQKRSRFSESPESSGKKKTTTTALVASMKAPAPAAPGPVAPTKAPVLAAPGLVASTKAPVLAAPSPFAMAKPPPLAVPIPVAIARPPGLAALSPVATPKPIAVVNPATPVVVKQERNDGGDEGAAGAMAVAVAQPEVWINLDVPMKRLHCAVCHSPLKPPIFQCEDGHVVCGACGGGDTSNNNCRACESDGRTATYSRFSYMDGLVGDFKAPCPYKKFGCSRSMAYHEAAEHKAECACAPCYCLECVPAFEGSPTTLLRHLTAAGGRHAWPVENIKYDNVHRFVVPLPAAAVPAFASEHRRLLVAEEDSRVFLLAVGAGRARGVRPVTVLCVRGNAGAGADARPLYQGVLWVEGPPIAAGKVRGCLSLEEEVASCASPADVDMDDGRLHVHVKTSFLHGVSEAKELHLRIRISKLA